MLTSDLAYPDQWRLARNGRVIFHKNLSSLTMQVSTSFVKADVPKKINK